MDVGILTYHNNSNRGAILQSYCLCEAVESLEFVESAEVIDYRTRSKEISRLLSIRPKRLLRKITDYRIPTRFLKEHSYLSKETKITDNHSKAIDFIRRLDYDLLIVGSDVVWRRLPNSNRPFPNAYFLDPSLEVSMATYAASANKMQLSELSQEEREIFEDHVSSFDAISVRDSHTEDLLTELGISDIKRVPDPTFLVDIPQTNIEDKLASKGVNMDKPILAIHGPDQKPFRILAEKYSNKGFQIATPSKKTYSDYTYGASDPIEYHSYYNNFDFVITSSLHSTIFSFLNATPFVTIDVFDEYQTLESKTESLLAEIDMTERHIDAVDRVPDNLYETVSDLEDEIDDQTVAEKLSNLRSQGLEYLSTLEEIPDETNN